MMKGEWPYKILPSLLLVLSQKLFKRSELIISNSLNEKLISLALRLSHKTNHK